jgi:hypothetical protein
MDDDEEKGRCDVGRARAMSLHVAAVDLYDPVQAAIWLDLLDHYARDPMGGGEGLSDYAKLNLVTPSARCPVSMARWPGWMARRSG